MMALFEKERFENRMVKKLFFGKFLSEREEIVSLFRLLPVSAKPIFVDSVSISLFLVYAYIITGAAGFVNRFFQDF